MKLLVLILLGLSLLFVGCINSTPPTPQSASSQSSSDNHRYTVSKSELCGNIVLEEKDGFSKSIFLPQKFLDDNGLRNEIMGNDIYRPPENIGPLLATECRPGSKSGENVNWLYCDPYVPTPLTKKLISPEGIVLGTEHYWVHHVIVKKETAKQIDSPSPSIPNNYRILAQIDNINGKKFECDIQMKFD